MKLSCAIGALVLIALAATAARAQTDFYNTDRGRPLMTEDAIVIERRAFELQAAPITFTRVSRGVSLWGIAPELAWGIAPRTQVEFALPFAIVDDGTRPRAFTALAGAELGVLHQLNAETAIPALALGVDVRLPAGPLAPARAIPSLRALLTRTNGWGRIHLNGSWTPAADLDPSAVGADDAQRWSAGVAVDHTFVLRSVLLGAEVLARTPLVDGADTEWRAATGVRQQLSPRVALDAGLGRRLSGPEAGWSLTMGAAYAFAPHDTRGTHGGHR